MKKYTQAYLGMIINQQATMKMIISRFLGLAFLVGNLGDKPKGWRVGFWGLGVGRTLVRCQGFIFSHSMVVGFLGRRLSNVSREKKTGLRN